MKPECAVHKCPTPPEPRAGGYLCPEHQGSHCEACGLERARHRWGMCP